jgi:hypothetical protein
MSEIHVPRVSLGSRVFHVFEGKKDADGNWERKPQILVGEVAEFSRGMIRVTFDARENGLTLEHKGRPVKQVAKLFPMDTDRLIELG